MLKSKNYPKKEISKLNEINKLLKQWEKEVSNAKVPFRDEGRKKYDGNLLFSWDGFFPYYFGQKPKVLFVGREDREWWYTVKEWMDIFKKADLSNQGFFVPLLQILYGINNNFTIDYINAPDRNEIAETIGTEKGLSFAILELSKYGNKNEDSGKHYDKELMKRFFKDSNLDKFNYFEKELSILDPDIIVTMNIWELPNIKNYINKYIFPENEIIHSMKYIDLHKVKINNRNVPLLDTYHFSAPGKNNQDNQVEKYFYNPVKKMIKSKTFEKEFIDFKNKFESQ